jgi:hypothetical protein
LAIKELIARRFTRVSDTAILPEGGLPNDGGTRPFCFAKRVFYGAFPRRRAIAIFSCKTCGANAAARD